MPLLDAITRMTTASGRACRTLMKAEFFAIGPIGASARISSAERALIRILREPAATTMLLETLPRATLAGQLYILVGLQERGYTSMGELLDEYRGRTDEVTTQTACLRGSQPVRNIVARIAEGTYLLQTRETG